LSSRTRLVGLLFFLSGAAALVYQVAWQRLLALLSGVSSVSVSIIVAAFMAGLGLGAEWGGRRSVRLAPGRALFAFACLELGIAAFGYLSPFVYYDLLYGRFGHLYASPWAAAALHLGALLPPTLLMGMSLPFLARATVLEAPTAARTIGLLYAVNVAGAASGALLAPWVLIRFLGVTGAIHAAAGLNLVAGLSALALARRSEADAGGSEAAHHPEAGLRETVSFRTCLLLYGLSGACALALEVLWFRVVDVAVRSSAFSFGTVLSVYLAGLAAGGAVAARHAPRVTRPVRLFLLCQCALLLYAGLALTALVRLPPDFPPVDWLVRYWEGDDDRLLLGRRGATGPLLALYGALPSVLFGPATFLMGLSFPLLQRAVQDDPRLSGRRVGALQAANILGCIAGSLGVGLLALDRLGSAGTLRLVVGSGLVFAAVGASRHGARSFAPLAAALALVAAAMPDGASLWRRLHGSRDDERTLVAEDRTGVAALVPIKVNTWKLMVGGHSHSVIPYQGVHSLLGAVPALLHPAPRRIALIGLGSGDTAWAAGLRPETERLEVFELVGAELDLLRGLGDRAPREVREFLRDPRVQIRVEDGRHALRQTAERYDLVEMDPLKPEWGMSGHIYSREFFEMARERLAPGGLFCAWTPTPRVERTIEAAFPHVRYVQLMGLPVALASREPLSLDVAAARRRLELPAVRDYLGVRLLRVVRACLADAELLPPDAVPGTLNTDLFPRDELKSP